MNTTSFELTADERVSLREAMHSVGCPPNAIDTVLAWFIEHGVHLGQPRIGPTLAQAAEAAEKVEAAAETAVAVIADAEKAAKAVLADAAKTASELYDLQVADALDSPQPAVPTNTAAAERFLTASEKIAAENEKAAKEQARTDGFRGFDYDEDGDVDDDDRR